MCMTDITPDAPGDPPVQPEHSGEPAEVPAPAHPANAGPSPWAPTGYQYSTEGQPHSYSPAAVPTPERPAAGYPQTAGQPAATYPSTGYPGYFPSGGQATGPHTVTLPAPEPRRRRRAGLVVGVAALALVVGGAAGGLGGYLVSTNRGNSGGSGPVTNALNQQAPAQSTSNAPAGSIQAVAQQVLPTVVEIAATFQATNGANGDTGSGVVISSDGDILTNNHVVQQAATGNGTIQVIFQNGKTVSANVVGRDPTTDIAVIKAQGVSGLAVAQLVTQAPCRSARKWWPSVRRSNCPAR
jgi:putative serine protease PepD